MGPQLYLGDGSQKLKPLDIPGNQPLQYLLQFQANIKDAVRKVGLTVKVFSSL